jgi:maltokinase
VRSTEDLTTAAAEQALVQWLPGQRWFAGKGVAITGLKLTEQTELTEPGQDPALWHLIAEVRQENSTDDYQVLVGLRAELPDRLEHVRIGTLPDGRTAYDALHDHELARVLLHGIAGEQTRGPLRFGRVRAEAFEAGTDHKPTLASEDIESLVMTAEQSNTSLVYGEEAILKVFRRVAPGPNPDLEVSVALSRLGSPHVAAPLGWIEMGCAEMGGAETGESGDRTILAILSQYLRAASDGWSMAATSVRDLYAVQDDGQPAEGRISGQESEEGRPFGQESRVGAAEAGGDFAGEAHRLGEATAEVHAGLARAFGTEMLPPGTAAEMAAQMRHRLEEAVAAVPALREHADLVAAVYRALAEVREPIAAQRIHGDYHLGQVMRTQAGWVVLDFEGEPAAPLATRRGRFSPLRDVAGMLRSFDYAARHQLVAHPDRVALELPARDWVRRNTDAFCAGYAEASGVDPRGHAVLLRALEFDKAVYEVRYEARNRPSWLPVPLDSLAAAVPVSTPQTRAGDTL